MGVNTSKRSDQIIKAGNIGSHESDISLAIESFDSSSLSSKTGSSSESEIGTDGDNITVPLPKEDNKEMLNKTSEDEESQFIPVESKTSKKRVHFSRPEIESKVLDLDTYDSDVGFGLKNEYDDCYPMKSVQERAPTPKRPEKFVLDNSAVFNIGRKDIFRASESHLPSVEPMEMKTNSGLTLKPAKNRKPGQTAILEQLGRQGILLPSAKTERSIAQLRQAGMMGSIGNSDRESSYVPSSDDQKRPAPRLVPLKKSSEVQKENYTKPPWEKEIFPDDRNLSCYTPSDLNPPMYNSSGKSWDDEVMPLEIKWDPSKCNGSQKMKIKMMDLDLL